MRIPPHPIQFGSDCAPRTAPFGRAVVHHGGVGTTAAVLRAGVPGIIVPFAVDQPFWGRRVASLGVGIPPIPRQDLTAEKFAAAIRTATSEQAMKDRACALAEKIRSENGVARAVEIFHRHLPNHNGVRVGLKE